MFPMSAYFNRFIDLALSRCTPHTFDLRKDTTLTSDARLLVLDFMGYTHPAPDV